MAILERDDEDLIATDADLHVALSKALARVDLTFDELQDRARSGRFGSEAERITWMAVRDLGDLR